MTPQELELLIKQGEGYNLEFKQSLPSKASDLAEEICAFANAAGGTLLIGVDDKGKVVGVSMDNTSRSRMRNILNCIEPHIELSVTEVAVNEKTVLSLECKAGKEKPYTVSGSIIVRNGPNSEKIGLFLRMGMVEKVGSGINRMKDEMTKANLPAPIFSLDGFFTAKFYRPINFDKWILNWSGKLNAPLMKMLDALHKNPFITKPELADILGQGKTSIDNHIAQLKSLGMLSRQGSRKNGKWVVHLIPLPTN
jgi:predicted HTH transcriptional regulator